MKKIIIKIVWWVGRFLSIFYPYSLRNKTRIIKNKLYTAWLSGEFNEISESSTIFYPIDLIGGKYISIGTNCFIGKRTVLSAWDWYACELFEPKIFIGNNVIIGDESHITAINRIEIGNNVLTGKKITITDNAHGKSIIELLSISPVARPLYSEGPVNIEDGVWIGDKVTILPNVRIGRNSIIGANAVVTRDIPANSVAVGVPAKVIKTIE